MVIVREQRHPPSPNDPEKLAMRSKSLVALLKEDSDALKAPLRNRTSFENALSLGPGHPIAQLFDFLCLKKDVQKNG
jgi:hypothetical protein